MVEPRLAKYGDISPPEDYRRPPLPPARGPRSEWVLTTLARCPAGGTASPPPEAADDPVLGDDSALALYLLYELHYRGLAGVDDGWEWQPDLLAARGRLETDFLDRLRDAVPMPDPPTDVAAALRRRTRPGGDGPSLASFCEEQATWEQMLELCVQRTAWQQKEADPHSWAFPRLGGRPKAALAEIQAGEYGEGAERDVHQNLYALTLSLLGLESGYGHYLERLPGTSLATVNLATLFGLHRAWVPAMVGHLAAFEMSSVQPMSAYSAALRRLGAPRDACHFFDVHVVADAHHQRVAADKLAVGLVEQRADAGSLVLFGADTLAWVEAAFADSVMDAWREGRSSLLHPLTADEVMRPA